MTRFLAEAHTPASVEIAKDLVQRAGIPPNRIVEAAR